MSNKKKTNGDNNEQESVLEEVIAPETPEEEDPAITLKNELSAERDKYLRLAAEYDNFRKRSAKERELMFADVRADTVTKFLQVYDNLERALNQETADEAYRKGVEMTMAQFLDTLEKMGVSAIPALGEKFDPEMHNAIEHGEDDSQGESTITVEFQKGFKLGDRVIRFSLVKVVN